MKDTLAAQVGIENHVKTDVLLYLFATEPVQGSLKKLIQRLSKITRISFITSVDNSSMRI